jgi:hypothetical protein
VGKDEPLRFDVEALTRSIVRVNLHATSHGDSWRFLLAADRHHDNPHADWELEKRHLDEMREVGAGWVDGGDLFCCMNGRHDPRRARVDVRPEHAMAPDYLDAVVRDAANFYAPYARHAVVVGRGNHEVSISKNCDTDLTERLCERMSQQSKRKVIAGGYGGWVHFRAQIRQERYALRLKWFHGSGGAALMSFDTLKVRRMGAVLPDADVVMCGHVHKQWVMPLARERLVIDRQGARVEQDVQWHVRTGTYKNEYEDGYGSWHVQQGRTPEMLGAVWMTIRFQHRDNGRGARTWELVPEFRLAN